MLSKINQLGIALIVTALVFSQNLWGVIIVHNDTSVTIKARCIGKGTMRRTWKMMPGGRVMIGCQPSYVSQGIEVEIQNHQTREILRKTWPAAGMIEPAGKHIVVHVKEQFDPKSGSSIYRIAVKK